jgi:hypothetical protein
MAEARRRREHHPQVDGQPREPWGLGRFAPSVDEWLAEAAMCGSRR